MPDDIGERKVDDEDLNKERRAADEVDVDLCGNAEEWALRELQEREQKAEKQTNAYGKRGDFKREACAAQKEREARGNEGEIKFHGVSIETDQCRRSAGCGKNG